MRPEVLKRRLRESGAVLMIVVASPVAGAAQAPASAPPAAPAVDEAARDVAVAPVPAWVVDRGLPDTAKLRLGQTEEGIAYLVADSQVQVRADGHHDWFRSAKKVVNRSGLEAAGQIALVFDPAFESVDIHFVRVIRGGKTIDLTAATRFRVVEQEDDLDDGIVKGTLKAIANIPDVRVGDIVDYATTTRTRTTLWPGHAFFAFTQTFSDPLALYGVRYLWPAGMTPQYKAINGAFSFRTKASASGLEWERLVLDQPEVEGEVNVPPEAFQWGRVAISTMKDWGEVARWAVPLYAGDEALPPSLTDRLDAIARRWPDPADRLTEITRFVQDEIRYVGEELGAGSFVPRRPAVVFARGYGDCKDKSLLLARALRHVGIEAVPALVSTRIGGRLPDLLPSPLEFDHVIVRAEVGGTVLWLDPTGAHPGGRGLAIVPSDLGYALPIRAGQAALEKMTGYGARAGAMTVLEQFAVDEAAAVPLTLHVETRYTDARADDLRAALAKKSVDSFSKGNLDFYLKRFPGLVETRPLEINDDRDRNIVTMVENYSMSAAAFKAAEIGSKLTTIAYAVENVLPDRQTGKRVNPLALPPHHAAEQIIELRVKDRVLGVLDDVKPSGGLAFARTTTRLPDGVRIVYRLNTDGREAAPPEEAEAVYKLSDGIKEDAYITYYLDKSPKVAAAPDGIDPAQWAPVREDVEAAAALVHKPDAPSKLEALAKLNAVLAKVPSPSPLAGLVEGIRGALLIDLQRPQAAYASLQAATRQFDGNPEVYRLWIAVELDQGTTDTVAAAFRRTAAVQPKVLAAIDKQWVRFAIQKTRALPAEKREAAREDLCILLDQVGFQQQPRTGIGKGILDCAIVAHSRRGELAAARAALAKGPTTAAGVYLALDRRHQALWGDVDRLMGSGFRKSLEQDVKTATAAAEAAPRDYPQRTEQMQTLRAVGRYAEAIAAGKALADDKAQIEVIGADAFWLVNEYARNLWALGRFDEALGRMSDLLALDVQRYPDLGPLAINRSEMLLRLERYQETVDALTSLETKAPTSLNDVGKMWLWANRACALRGMGRAAEAKADEDRIVAKTAENWSAATLAAACRGDVAAVSALLVTRLRDEDTRPGALPLFITFQTAEGETPFEARINAVVDQAKASPAVVEAFGKVGRTVRYAGSSQGWSDF